VSAGSPAPSPLAATPNPSSAPNVAGGGPRTTSGGGSAPGGGPPRGIAIPLTSIVVRGPLNVALVVSVAVLPLLFGLWLLLFARTWTRARLAKDARLRLALASDLGLTPSQLESLSTQALFKLRDRAAFDELTGVLRRAAGIAATDREIARARRESRPLAVAFVDVDGLKQTNDRRGHRAGDDLLRNLAGALRSGLRGQDLIFRYGGDEFVCVLPDTDEDAAREKIAEIQANASEQLAVRFCAGVTQMRKGDDVVNLLARADRQLYSLKAARGADGDASPQPQTPRPGRPIVV
jgi:diguanylate cyclase (GGDEF)-like protein